MGATRTHASPAPSTQPAPVPRDHAADDRQRPASPFQLTLFGPGNVLALQRAAGNQAVQRMLTRAPRRRAAAPPVTIQRALNATDQGTLRGEFPDVPGFIGNLIREANTLLEARAVAKYAMNRPHDDAQRGSFRRRQRALVRGVDAMHVAAASGFSHTALEKIWSSLYAVTNSNAYTKLADQLWHGIQSQRLGEAGLT